MFEDSLIEEKIKTHRGATTVVSFLLQACIVGIIILIPLIFTQALPMNVGRTVTDLIAPPPPPPPPPPPAARVAPQTAEVKPKTTPVITQELTQPLRVPEKIAMLHESAAPPQPAAMAAPAGVIGGVPGGVPGGQIGGVLGGVLNSAGTVAPKMGIPKRIRVSQGVSQGLLLHQVKPNYPAAAKNARIQGAVVLQAEISRDGRIQDLQVLQGPPILTTAAVDAVKQWKYKPYYLNGQPVEIATTITINFQLAG